MTAAIIVPYAPLCDARTRAMEWCFARWAALLPLAEIIVAADQPETDRPPGTFNKPRAVNAGLAIANPEATVIVIADCDSTTDAAIELRVKAAREGKWSCSMMYRRLTEEQTEEALLSEPMDAGTLPRTDDQEQTNKSWSGVIVLPRAALQAIGGRFDERFDGWSADDVALAAALETLYRPVTRIGTVWHLHHPRPLSDSYGRDGYEHARDLTEQYEAAKGDVEAMRRVISGSVS